MCRFRLYFIRIGLNFWEFYKAKFLIIRIFLHISIVIMIINKGKTNKSYDYGKNIYYYQLWQD